MKTKTAMMILSLGAALAVCGSAFAETSQQANVEKLAAAKDRLVAGAQSVKPGQAMRMRDQADDLQKLIDAAQRGKKLDSSQVDNAIRRSYQNY